MEPLAYCSKCKTQTKTYNLTYGMSVKNQPTMKGQCLVCGTFKSTFLKGTTSSKNKTEENGLSEPDSS